MTLAYGLFNGATSDPIVAFATLTGIAFVAGTLGLLLACVAFAQDAGNRRFPVSRTVVTLTVLLVVASAVMLAQEEDPGLVYGDMCAQVEGTVWWYLWGCYLKVMLLRILVFLAVV